MNLIPGLAGVFLGAPLLAGELERGTHRMVWAQSVTRTRWMGMKLGLMVPAVIALAIILGLLLVWWIGAATTLKSGLDGNDFDLVGVMPVVYSLFASAIGVAAGRCWEEPCPPWR